MNNISSQISLFLQKQEKVYLQPGETSPKGAIVQQGKRGGRYYTGNFHPNVWSSQKSKPRLDAAKEQVKKLFDIFPRKHVNNLRVYVTEKNQLGGANRYGAWDPDAQAIGIAAELLDMPKNYIKDEYEKDLDISPFAVSITHELGHKVMETTKYLMSKWRKATKNSKDRVSEWSKQNLHEHFADSYLYYIFSPSKLKERDPLAFKFMDEIVFPGWRKQKISKSEDELDDISSSRKYGYGMASTENTQMNTPAMVRKEFGSTTVSTPTFSGGSGKRLLLKRIDGLISKSKTPDIKMSVKAIVHKGNKILILKDAYSDFWDLPGGHINNGEVQEEALIREVQEETGLSISNIKERGTLEMTLGKETKPVCFFDVKTSGEPKLSEEHTDFKWIGSDEIDDFNLGKFKIILKAGSKDLQNLVKSNDDAVEMYHGTSNSRWQKIKTEGLIPPKPGQKTFRGSEKDPKNKVFLTPDKGLAQTYARYISNENDPPAVVKVKVPKSKLQRAPLMPKTEWMHDGSVHPSNIELEKAIASAKLKQKILGKIEQFEKERIVKEFLEGYEKLALLSKSYSDDELGELFQCANLLNQREGFQLSLDGEDRISLVIFCDSVAHNLHSKKDSEGKSQYKKLDDLADISKSVGENDRNVRLLLLQAPETNKEKIQKLANIEVLQKGLSLEKSESMWGLLEKAIKMGVEKLSNKECILLREFLFAKI